MEPRKGWLNLEYEFLWPPRHPNPHVCLHQPCLKHSFLREYLTWRTGNEGAGLLWLCHAPKFKIEFQNKQKFQTSTFKLSSRHILKAFGTNPAALPCGCPWCTQGYWHQAVVLHRHATSQRLPCQHPALLPCLPVLPPAAVSNFCTGDVCHLRETGVWAGGHPPMQYSACCTAAHVVPPQHCIAVQWGE